MSFSSAGKLLSVSLLCLVLAACDSAEERAQQHYETGVSLVSEGDLDRARIEFRNALQLDPALIDARRELAHVLLEQGNVGGALGDFQRVAEQDPEDLETRIILAREGFLLSQWEIFDRNAEQASALAPENQEVQILELAQRFRAAALDDDAEALEAVVADAETLGESLDGTSEILSQILIDGYINASEYEAALTQLDQAISASPDTVRYYSVKAQLLARLGEMDAVQETMQTMVERFPQDDELRGQYLQFLVSQGRTETAEAFLRDRVEAADSDERLARLTTYIRFLSEAERPEAAMAELEERIAEFPDETMLRSLRASLNFTTGQRDEAISELEAILAGDTEQMSPENLERTRMALAMMLETTGNRVGARRLVEDVLATNADAAEALKMQARWQIADDRTDAAITGLRNALAAQPEDTEAMTLMANAHQRAGNSDLMRNFLSLAVESSGNAPEPSRRYASALAENGNLAQAEETLVAALRLQPRNIDLLTDLGQLYERQNDTTSLRRVIDSLDRIDNTAAQDAASAFRVVLRASEDGTAEAVTYLEELAQEDDRLRTTLVRAHLQAGEYERALNVVDELIEEDSENPNLRYMRAIVMARMGDVDAAREAFSTLVDEVPGFTPAWTQLIRLEQNGGASEEEVLALVDRALENTDRASDLLWMKASLAQSMGDLDTAITLHEELYERNSQSVVVANNLASLLSTQRTDAESLDRAERIARRLRESDVPAFQDTYGWIQYRTGNAEQAVSYLEPAAEGLPQDGQVQYHLAMAYDAVGRQEDALQHLRRAADLIGPLADPALVEDIRTKTSELEEALAANR